MLGTMLADQTWSELDSAATYAALIDLLKDTVYGPYLGAIEDKDLTPRRAVYQLRKHLVYAFSATARLTPEPARELVVQLSRRYEVDNLKALLRGVETGESWDRVRYVLFPLGPHSVLPAEEMIQAETVEAAVEQLRGTPYYQTLSHALRRYAAERSLFPLEVALDLDYWRELWREANQLPSSDRAHARPVIGSLLDANNLMWAIRYRVNHHMSEEEIINYTLPLGYRVRDEHIRAIAAGADIAQVVSEIYPMLAETAPLLREPRQGLPQLEVQLQRHVANECRQAFVGHPFNVGIPLAYLVLMELEIQDLTVLIEAKSSQVPSEGFRRYLVNEFGDARD
jgi:V/A-type H+-transporting ATPase subunit C